MYTILTTLTGVQETHRVRGRKGEGPASLCLLPAVLVQVCVVVSNRLLAVSCLAVLVVLHRGVPDAALQHALHHSVRCVQLCPGQRVKVHSPHTHSSQHQQQHKGYAHVAKAKPPFHWDK